MAWDKGFSCIIPTREQGYEVSEFKREKVFWKMWIICMRIF